MPVVKDTVNEFVPFAASTGELEFRLTLDPARGTWSIRDVNDATSLPQSYGPVFAFTRLRMAQQMTPHRRFKAPKTKK